MSRNVLVTGGTVFVSRYVAEYFAGLGDNVYVLNRNSRPQSEGVTLIEADRHQLGDVLKGYAFDVVLDVTAYTKEDVEHLLDGLGTVGQYIFISSSAVYPETLPQPFTEEQECGPNQVWGSYGANKLEAERYLLKRVPQAYVLRPPYLYGPMQNLYREGFVFDCADAGRPFYLPGDGSMPLQFFHIEDLCRFMERILEKQPEEHIFNVGNPEVVDIRQWVTLCYEAAGACPEFVAVDKSHHQRSYFCFHDYGYQLDVAKQQTLMPDVKPLGKGLKESYQWYQEHKDSVGKRPYLEYIDTVLKK